MFAPIPGGKKFIIKDAFNEPVECWIPPVGYGLNSITGKLEKTEILKRSNKKEEQYWEREDLPDWYAKKHAAAELLRKTDPNHVDNECEKIAEKHWNRRLRGVWFMNNGEYVYITGLHWFVLNWWKFQGKYFDFRIPNMEFFYFIDYCIEDPDCLGDIEITKRKEGKTARLGAFLYEYTSRTPSKHAGLQSKTDGDAAEVFEKAIVTPWRKLPHFFRPIYDIAAGDSPKNELRFFNSSKKGRELAKGSQDVEALESFIDYEGRGVLAYDGPELHRYGSDEAGKNKDISILDRHNVVQFCSEVDGHFVGKHHYTTTVEEMESGGSEFQKLVKMSDRRERDANGRTKSGLYVYFLPAYRTLFYDKYGYPDEVKAREYYQNKRVNLRNNPHELSSFIRKNPFTLEEAFRVDGDKCLYNPELLNDQLDSLTWRDNVTTRGNFVWKNNEPFTEVEFKPSKSGKFQVSWLFDELAEANQVREQNGRFAPAANFAFACGADPFKYNKVKDARRSDCAAFIYKKYAGGTNEYDDSFVCMYKFRAADTSIQYEDILKMCWYYGCQVLFERNVDNWREWFKAKKCEDFLMRLPGEDDYGLYSDGHGKTAQLICDHTEHYINEHVKKVPYKELIEDWLEFKVEDTTAYDCAMAAGFTLIAAKNKKFIKKEVTNDYNMDNYFRRYKAS